MATTCVSGMGGLIAAVSNSAANGTSEQTPPSKCAVSDRRGHGGSDDPVIESGLIGIGREPGWPGQRDVLRPVSDGFELAGAEVDGRNGEAFVVPGSSAGLERLQSFFGQSLLVVLVIAIGQETLWVAEIQSAPRDEKEQHSGKEKLRPQPRNIAGGDLLIPAVHLV